jgi:hypothetical protein
MLRIWDDFGLVHVDVGTLDPVMTSGYMPVDVTFLWPGRLPMHVDVLTPSVGLRDPTDGGAWCRAPGVARCGSTGGVRTIPEYTCSLPKGHAGPHGEWA